MTNSMKVDVRFGILRAGNSIFFSESSELQISILVLPTKENEDSKVFWLLLFEKYIAQ